MPQDAGRAISRLSRLAARAARGAMRRAASGLLAGGLLALLAPAASAAVPRAQLLSQPLAFETNRGQFDAPVRYAARGRDYTLFLTPDEAVLRLHDAAGTARVVRSQLLGAKPKPALSAEVPQPGRSHYLVGKDPAQWRRNIEHHGRVRYHAVYPGVDLVYHGTQGELEYDFELAPRTDPAQIRVRYSGIDDARLADNGDLLLTLAGNELVVKKPVVYQTIDERRVPVDGRFAIARAGKAVDVAFALGRYDRDRMLVIDPQLIYSTYLGGADASFSDDARAIAVDDSGAVYVTGRTSATEFPKGFSSGKLGPGGGSADAFVTKLDANGALVYSTYLGGTSTDEGQGIAVDGSGQAVVTGRTFSINFPVPSALFPSHTAGSQFDAFVTQLSADGATLLFSTYLGSNKTDVGNAIAVDAAGAIYVVGSTESGATVAFPTTASRYQASHGGTNDVFLTKLAPGGQSLAYSSLLGGTGSDLGQAVAVDAAGKAYVAGTAGSSNFPTKSAAQATSNGGGQDAFVAVFDTTNTGEASLVFSTYLGGGGVDSAYSIAAGSDGRIYVTGETTPNAATPVPFPVSATPLDGTAEGIEAFVTVFSASGSRVYSSLLGGSGTDKGRGIVLDGNDIYLCGETSSTDFPAIAVPLAEGGDNNAGGPDAFVVQLNAVSGGSTSAVFGSYFGGSGNDACNGVAVGGGQIFIAGTTSSSTNFPLQDAAQSSFGGGIDGFVARIGEPIVVGPGEIKLVSAAASGTEKDTGTTAVTIAVSRSGGVGAVSVSYATAPGTATADVDYESKTGTLNWPDGDTANKSVTLNIKSDSLTEGNETFTLSLSGPTGGATLGDPVTRVATITITDDDIPTPGKLRLDGTLNEVAENAGVLVATVFRGGGKDGAVTVDYAAVPSDPESALAGLDYTAISGTLSWGDQDAEPKTFEVPILDDTAFEGAQETFALALSNPTGGAELGVPSSYTVKIIEDDPPQPGSLQFEPAIVSGTESSGVATVTVARVGGADGSVSVKYATQTGSAAAGIDYNPIAGTLNWATGDAAPKTLTLQLINDGAVEGDESFGLVLSEPVSQYAGVTLGASATATVVIVDDEVADAGSVGMNASTLEVDEAAGLATVAVMRAGSGAGEVSVAYSTLNGQAVGGADFTATSGRLYWAAGDLAPKTIEIPILPDVIVEGGENFTVLLSSPAGGLKLLAQSSTTVVITDAQEAIPPRGNNGGNSGGGAPDWRLLLALLPLALVRRRHRAGKASDVT